MILIIADYLELSIDYLLGLSDENLQRKTLDGVPFHKRLEELGVRTDKKYGTIATAVGISRSQFNSWKLKNYTPSLEIGYQLALYFQATIDYLLARKYFPKLKKAQVKLALFIIILFQNVPEFL